jgi:hypothetical protein
MSEMNSELEENFDEVNNPYIERLIHTSGSSNQVARVYSELTQ